VYEVIFPGHHSRFASTETPAFMASDLAQKVNAASDEALGQGIRQLIARASLKRKAEALSSSSRASGSEAGSRDDSSDATPMMGYVSAILADPISSPVKES